MNRKFSLRTLRFRYYRGAGVNPGEQAKQAVQKVIVSQATEAVQQRV